MSEINTPLQLTQQEHQRKALQDELQNFIARCRHCDMVPSIEAVPVWPLAMGAQMLVANVRRGRQLYRKDS